MAKKANVDTNENVKVTPKVAPDVKPAKTESVNAKAADPKVNGEATTTPDVSEETTVKSKVKSKNVTKVDSEFERLVEETLNGVHGSGRERMLVLGAQYFKVQQEVNRRLR